MNHSQLFDSSLLQNPNWLLKPEYIVKKGPSLIIEESDDSSEQEGPIEGPIDIESLRMEFEGESADLQSKAVPSRSEYLETIHTVRSRLGVEGSEESM